jgi:hypothetical protein
LKNTTTRLPLPKTERINGEVVPTFTMQDATRPADGREYKT